jgi:subtilisin family serine protease
VAKLIVFPAASALMAASMGTVAGAAALAQEVSVRGALERRRIALQNFAHSVVRSSARALTAEALATSAGVTAPGYEVLAGIGALLVDEDLVDRAALEATHGASVFENVRVPLIAPSPSAAMQVEAPSKEAFWHLAQVNVGAARAKKLIGQGILVGVLDTGIDATHPEFKAKTVYFQEFDSQGREIPGGPRDAGYHGTHVCGLLAGRNAGIASGADLAVAAVLTAPGMGGEFAQIVKGLDWLTTTEFRGPNGVPGVDVLNASLGAQGYNDFLHTALAMDRLTKGTVLFAAIGNDGALGANHHRSPGNYDIVVGVGATDRKDQVASFSSWGTVPQQGGIAKPDLCAPGVGVLSSVPGGYRALDGTSMAAPIVAGAAALLLQRSPSLTTDAVKLTDAILKLTKPLPNVRAGRGRLDLTNI